MYAMKTIKRILLAGLVAVVATSCTSALYTSSGSAYDDLYAVHDRTAIANRQKAEAEARRAEAEARQAEAMARQAELEAKLAELGVMQAESGTRTDSDGVIIVDDNTTTRSTNIYDSYLASDYESAYARRLLGFKSATYNMPSSYFNLRYNGDYMYVSAYDPAFYNVMVSGDQVWVEPKYISSMFGTWGATNATMLVHSPWYYGWNSVVYNPWYYSSWGYPRYSWYDWNWNICYGSSWGLGLNLWWGWGGIYRPWRPYHYHTHHIGGVFHHGPYLGGGGGYMNHYYGSRHNAPRNNFGPVHSSRTIVDRSSGRATPYRSPSTGKVYETSRGTVNKPTQGAPAQNSVGRTQGVNRYTGTSRSKSYAPSTQQRQSNSSNPTRSNSSVTRNNNSSSTSRSSYSPSSSFGSSSTRGGGGGFSGGGGGGSHSSGSRGR